MRLPNSKRQEVSREETGLQGVLTHSATLLLKTLHLARMMKTLKRLARILSTAGS
jgi:hypothetical protein